MLPKLLAAYKKYGSLESGWPMPANHFWRVGATVDSTKNGRPTTNVRIMSSHGTGFRSTGGTRPAGSLKGRIISGANARPTHNNICHRDVLRCVTALA